jgi:biopolymer transport protein ExbD
MAFGGFNEGGSGAPMSEINTTPLVDVMLVLLIIFIVTAPLLTHAIKIDLPQTASRAEPDPPKAVTLSINGEGETWWDEQKIDASELGARLAELAGRDPQPELHLRVDREARYQKLAEVMDAAKQAGVQKLGFVTQPGGVRAK